MQVQHKDLPDSELHGIKGASTAIVGSVPVANGSGATNFQKLGVSNFTGSIPPNISDLVLLTDGTGGFKSNSPVRGQFTQIYTRSVVLTGSLMSGGILVDNNAVRIPVSGVYLYMTGSISYVPGGESSTEGITFPFLINANNSSVLFTGMSGLVNLDSSIPYRLNQPGVFTLWKVNV